jgi:hypothetical protein
VSSPANVGTAAPMREPSATAISEAMSAWRRIRPSAMRDTTGVATTPTSSVMITVHWAAARETCRSTETSRMIGLPRPATTAPESAANDRQAISPAAPRRRLRQIHRLPSAHASSNRVALAIPPPSHMVCSP